MINLKKGNTNLTNLTGPSAISSATLDTMRINMSPVTNIHLNTSSTDTAAQPSRRAADPKEVEVHYPGSDVAAHSLERAADDPNTKCDEVTRDIEIAADNAEKLMVEKLDELARANEVLRLVIKLIQSNPLQINHYVIADDALLVRIIQLLCNATDVNIDADDLGQGCVTKNKYRKIHSIYVTTPNGIKNLKYDFPHVMKQLKDLNISVKYVY